MAEALLRRPWTIVVLLIVTLACPNSLLAHRAEPISTEFALPFEPGKGNLKFTFSYDRLGRGASEFALPEVELETGVVPHLQINVGIPVVRDKEGSDEPATSTVGKLKLGGRYLLSGGRTRRYAFSFEGSVAAPTGNRNVVGDATELRGGLFYDLFLSDRWVTHSNFSWSTTVGGRQKVERLFEYHNAVVWFATYHWLPVFELVGASDTASGRTDLAAQPEMIYHASNHFEIKFGLPVGLTATTPRVGVRAQIAIIWGGD